MANRRITELQDIAGTALAEDDLFTVVHVGEVDPTLKNRKITLSGTKQYLSSYYLSKTGDTVSGALVIQGNLTVSGNTIFSAATLTGALTVGSVLAQSGIVASGAISGATVTGTYIQGTNVNGVLGNFTTITGNVISVDSGNFLTKVSGVTITGTSGAFTSLTGQTITGTSGGFVTLNATAGNFTSITGVTISGTTVTATTGIFSTITFTGVAVAGNLSVSGSGFFGSGVSVTGTITGTTVATTTGSFVSLTGTTATFTSGIIASGTAALPSLAILSDPNTGLFSPGADQVAISTNGTEKLIVKSDGTVGLGTSTPSAKLDVEAANFVGGPAIGIRYNTSNPRLGFNVANSNGFVYIGSNTNNKVSSDTPTYDLTGTAASQLRLDGGQLIFNNAPSGTAGNDISFTNRLTITSAGLVGIGTSAPNYQLHATTSFAVGASGFNQQLSFTNDTIQSLILGTGYTALKLNPLGGNVGIGTSSPAQALDVRTATGNAYINIGRNSQSTGQVGYYLTGGTSGTDWILYQPASSNDFRIFGNSGDRVTVTSTGSVGIGTTSPSQALHVEGNALLNGVSRSLQIGSSGAAFLYLSGTSGASEISHNSNALQLITSQTGGITFSTGGANERARIDSSGRLLVGGSSDSGGALFQVFGDRIRIGTAKTPASAGATGTAGEICWDANYIYVCTATNTWKRTAISTW